MTGVLPPGSNIASYGQFYPFDPNIDYVGGSIIAGGWEFSAAGQYTDYDAMWCTGANGN